MMKLLGVLVVLVATVVGWFVLRENVVPESIIPSLRDVIRLPTRSILPVPSSPTVNTIPESDTGQTTYASITKGGLPVGSTVEYDGSAFRPASFSVPSGSEVRFMNSGQKPLRIMSDLHPDHTLLPALNATSDIPPGGSWSVVLGKVGTWSFHNEHAIDQFGTIQVIESTTQ